MLRACVADTLVLAVMPEAAPTAGSRDLPGSDHWAWEMLMRRREVAAILSGAAVWPVTAGAQQVGRTYRVGGLSPSPRYSSH